MDFVKDVWNNTDLIKTLKNGGIVVMPTDTIYGVVGSALNKNTVEKIFQIRKRDTKKPFLSLIGSIEDLEKFDIFLDKNKKDTLESIWNLSSEKPTTIEFNFFGDKFIYLHRGLNYMGIRLPKSEKLRKFLKEVGPLIAPSANLSGLPPAKTLEEAKKYFGDKVDMYVDGGEIVGQASKIIKLNQDGSIIVIRE